MTNGWSTPIDEAVAEAAGSVRSQTLTVVMRTVTEMNGLFGAFIFALGVVTTLLLTRRYREALYMTATTVGASLLFGVIKHAVARPRPLHGIIEQAGYSFPSGHATMSAAMAFGMYYLALGLHSPHPLRRIVLVGAVVWSGLIGISRVYLGVHWASDVCAGWALGYAWATLMFVVLFRVNGR